MKTLKTMILKVILSLFVVCAMFSATLFAVNVVKAATNEFPTDGTIEINDGISLKLNENGGMRFVVKMNKQTYDFVKTNDADNAVSLVVLIAPETLFDTYADYATRAENFVKIYIDENKLFTVDGFYYANACVINMQEENYNYDYAAVAYVVSENVALKESALNQNATGSFYNVANQIVLTTDEASEVLSLSSYSWLGTEKYPLHVKSIERYNSLVEKINNGVDFSDKNIKIDNFDMTNKTELAEGKRFPENTTAQNGITGLAVADIAYGGNPSPAAKSARGEIVYTYSDSENGVYSEWNAQSSNVGTWYVKATVAGGTDSDGVTYNGAEAISSFKVLKAQNAITFTEGEIALHCGENLPDFGATAKFGDVNYSYSKDGGETFVSASELGALKAGGSYIVKAIANGNDNYDGAEQTKAFTVSHDFGAGVTVDGITTARCACGAEHVSGEIAHAAINLDITVSDGVAAVTGGEIDLTRVYNGNANATITIGETANEMTVVNGKIAMTNISASTCGEKSIGVKITDGESVYELTVSALFVTKLISSEAGLQGVRAIETALNGNGYYMLANNIAMSNLSGVYWYSNSVNYIIGFDHDFVGTIDGNGYTISGIELRNNYNGIGHGFINKLGEGGTLKNVGFIDLYLHDSGSIVKRSSGGVVENVYAKYTIRGNKTYMATFCENYDYITLKNVVIDFSEAFTALNKEMSISTANPTGKLLGQFVEEKSSLENVVIFGIDSKWNDNIITLINESGATISTDIDKLYVFNSDTMSVNKTIPTTGWAKCWTISEGSLPVYKNAAPVTRATFTKSAVNIVKGESAEFEVGVNCILELGSDAKELGITYENGKVVVPESVNAGATFTVIARNIFDYNNPLEHVVTVLGQTIKETIDMSDVSLDLGATVDDGMVKTLGTDKEIDISSVFDGNCENATVTDNGKLIATVNITAGKFTLNTKTIESSGTVNFVVLIQTAEVTYEIALNNLIVVTKIIRTVEDIQSVASIADALNGGGYYVLGNDIAFADNSNWINYTIGKDKAKPFVGVFDGNGYTISKLRFNGNYNGLGFITNIGEDGILRNIAFTGAYLQGQSTIVSYATGGLIENVFVEVGTRWVGNQAKTGVFGINDGSQKLTLKNVVVDFRNTVHYNANETYNGLLLGNYSAESSLSNVMVLGVSDVWKNNVTVNGENAYVSYAAGGDNGVAFPTEWDSTYWTVDADNKTVTWETK